MIFKTWLAAAGLLAVSFSASASLPAIPDLGVLNDTTAPLTVEFQQWGGVPTDALFSRVYAFSLSERSDIDGLLSFRGAGATFSLADLHFRTLGGGSGGKVASMVPTLTGQEHAFSFKDVDAGNYLMFLTGATTSLTTGFDGSLTVTSAVPELNAGWMFMIGAGAMFGLRARSRQRAQQAGRPCRSLCFSELARSSMPASDPPPCGV